MNGMEMRFMRKIENKKMTYRIRNVTCRQNVQIGKEAKTKGIA